jgi:hypothetical protein
MAVVVLPSLDVAKRTLTSGVSGMGMFPASAPASDQMKTIEVLSEAVIVGIQALLL